MQLLCTLNAISCAAARSDLAATILSTTTEGTQEANSYWQDNISDPDPQLFDFPDPNTLIFAIRIRDLEPTSHCRTYRYWTHYLDYKKMPNLPGTSFKKYLDIKILFQTLVHNYFQKNLTNFFNNWLGSRNSSVVFGASGSVRTVTKLHTMFIVICTTKYFF